MWSVGKYREVTLVCSRANDPCEEHDRMVCGAVLIFLERNEKLTFSGVRFPDYENRETRDVDLLAECGTARLVLEHTLVQSYHDQEFDGIQFVDLLYPLGDELTGSLPPGEFTLYTGIGEVRGSKNADRIRASIADWIRQQAPTIALDGPTGNHVTGRPDRVPFEVTLLRTRGSTSRLKVLRSADTEALQEPLGECLKTALVKKLPKLAEAAEREDAQSVFVMESKDHLKDSSDVVAALEKIHETDYIEPDSIFIVETQCGEEWFVCPIRRIETGISAGDWEVIQETEASEYLKRLVRWENKAT